MGEKRISRGAQWVHRRIPEIVGELEAMGFNPLQVIKDELPNLTPYEKSRICSDLIQYLYPKRKSTEITINEEAIMAEFRTLQDLPKEQLALELERYAAQLRRKDNP